MGVPYCIVKGKARLGTVVHKKTATALAITEVGAEDKAQLSSLVSTIKSGFMAKAEEEHKHWGVGIMGAKTLNMLAKREAARAKEMK
jgi:large subunit ribosomal protein L7Ae